MEKNDITVYWASVSSNIDVKKHQQRVKMVLDSKKIAFNYMDICTNEGAKEEMKALCAENGVKTIAPQIVNKGKYCGDFFKFDESVEHDELEQFLMLK